MTNDAQPAESSPAPSTSKPFDLETMSQEERTNWRLTGDVPKDTPAETETPASSPADSTPAEPAEQAASTDASSTAASEPATPANPKTEARFKEILAERTRERDRADKAERELQALRAQQTKSDVPAPSPASAKEFPDYDSWSQAHPEQGYDDFLLDKFQHVQTQQKAIEQQVAAQEAFTRTAQERVTAFTGRYREALSADATLPTRIDPRLYDLKTVDACLQAGEPVTALNAVAQEIVESPQAVKLLVHLSEHPDTLASLASLSPAAVIRAMARLESQLDTPAIPPPKTISSAPALTTTLGTRPAVPGDPISSSVRSGDFDAYRKAMNKREMASK